MSTDQAVKSIVTDRPNEVERPIEHVKVSPLRQIATRTLRTWLQSFLGFASLLVVGSLVVDTGNWQQWLDATYLLGLGQRVLACAIVATAVALVSAGQNALEFLVRADATHPRLRA